MTYFSKKNTTFGTRTSAKKAKARWEVANLSVAQLNDAGIDVSEISHTPTFAVDARTMTSLMSLR